MQFKTQKNNLANQEAKNATLLIVNTPKINKRVKFKNIPLDPLKKPHKKRY